MCTNYDYALSRRTYIIVLIIVSDLYIVLGDNDGDDNELNRGNKSYTKHWVYLPNVIYIYYIPKYHSP